MWWADLSLPIECWKCSRRNRPNPIEIDIMGSNILAICYLIASVSFILGLKMLSNPLSARRGNLIATAGMSLAIIATIFLYENEGRYLQNYPWIFSGILIGTIIGTFS